MRDPPPIDMLLSAVSVLVVAQSSSEVPEGLMNNPVLHVQYTWFHSVHISCIRFTLSVHPSGPAINSKTITNSAYL